MHATRKRLISILPFIALAIAMLACGGSATQVAGLKPTHTPLGSVPVASVDPVVTVEAPADIPTAAPGRAPTPDTVTLPAAPGLIVFESDRDGSPQLYATTSDGSQTAQLTTGSAQNINPALSPSGSRIAFSSNRDGNWELYVMSTDSTFQTRLTDTPWDEFAPAWSPGESLLAFAANPEGQLDLFIMNIDDPLLSAGDPQQLTDNPGEDNHPAWSPVENQIAFTSERDGVYDIYTIAADNTLINLTNDEALDSTPAWSPDGSQLAFVSEREGQPDIYVLDVPATQAAGSGRLRLTELEEGARGPVWSPDGSQILFSARSGDNWYLFVMDADAAAGRQITSGSFSDRAATWQNVPERFASVAEEGPPTMLEGLVRGERTSRQVPAAPDATLLMPRFDLQINKVIRGDEAWQRIRAGGTINHPPGAGFEYLLINVTIVNVDHDGRILEVGRGDFTVTGDHYNAYRWASAIGLDALDGDLNVGEAAQGWIAYLVGVGEGSLMLVYDELGNINDRPAFIALQGEASLEIPSDLSEVRASDLGRTAASPAPLGQTAVTDDWEITLLEVLWGSDAWDRIREASNANDPPPPAMQYVLVRARVRYILPNDVPASINKFDFDSQDSNGVEYDTPILTGIVPQFDARLYSGGEFEGWFAKLLPEDDSAGALLVFSPLFDLSGSQTRYFELR